MKMEISIKSKVEVKTLIADMGVRYWEDGVVNGVQDDDDNPKMPLIENGAWKLRIDLASGVIADWPKGTTASVHYKVCDAGVYSLADAAGNVVAVKDGYVPAMLSPEGDGYGDYVILSVDAEGKIDGWEADLAYFEDDE